MNEIENSLAQFRVIFKTEFAVFLPQKRSERSNEFAKLKLLQSIARFYGLNGNLSGFGLAGNLLIKTLCNTVQNRASAEIDAISANATLGFPSLSLVIFASEKRLLM